MREPLRIKQILPIPSGFTVLTRVVDENGKKDMEDLTLSGWHYLFVLVDGGECQDDHVALYEMDPNGYEEIAPDGCRIVPKRKCFNCGSEMTPKWNEEAQDPLSFTCSCGATRC